MQWTPMPLLRAAAVLALGIAAQSHGLMPDNIFLAASVTVFFLFLSFISGFFFEGNPYIGLSRGLAGLIALFFLGWTTGLVHDPLLRSDHLSSTHSPQAYLVQIVSPPVPGPYGVTLRGELKRINDGQHFERVSGTVLLTFDSLSPTYADILWIKGAPRSIDPPRNPYAFDRRAFYALQGIYYQDKVKPGAWWLVGKGPPGIMEIALACRRWCLTQFEKFLPDRRERSIVAALVLGATEELDPEVRADYSGTGVIHVLAVSGLHVSILYGMLLLVLPGMTGRGAGPWITLTIGLAVLWVYACITGLSPSVLRAVVMFTIAALAWPLNRKGTMLNTLGASGFMLLLLEPSLLWSVGFQLSYAAVFGIMVYQPRFQLLFHPLSRVGRWVWSMVCVSLAAQLLTLPLTIYYFHQFPVYFLPANLIAVPAGFLLLCGGLILLATSWWAWLAGWTGWALIKMVFLLNECLSILHALPGSVVEHIPLSLVQCIMLYLGLTLITLLYDVRRFIMIWFLVIWSALYAVESWRLMKEARHPAFVVYHIREHLAVEWFSGRSSAVFIYPDLSDTTHLILRQMVPLRLARGIVHTRKLKAPRGGLLAVNWAGQHFLVSTGPLPSGVRANWTILSDEGMTALDTMKAGADFGTLILAGERARRKKWRWQPYIVAEQGAYYKQLTRWH